MTEPTKEQAWKEEARKAYQDQQSQDNEGGCREPVGFVQGYIAAKKSDFEEIERLKRNPSDFMLKCGECGNVVVWYEQYTYQVVIAGKDKEIKSLKEQLNDVTQLLRRIKSACSPSDIMNYEQELEKFLEKQDKENKDEK